MLQRVLIAMVVALKPRLIVADEPTSSLDNIVERQILALFRRMKSRIGAAAIFITHDISVAGALCDRIAVMYAGQIVEIAPARSVLEYPEHPYTKGLVAAATALDQRPDRLAEIPGQLPSLADPPAGCLFAPRCAFAADRCRTARPPLTATEDRRSVRCVLVQ